MGLLGEMFAAGVSGGAGFMADNIDRDIAAARQTALEMAREERAKVTREANLDNDFNRLEREAPARTKMKVAENDAMAEGLLNTKSRLHPEAQKLENAEREGDRADAEKNAPRDNKLKAGQAAAGRDPTVAADRAEAKQKKAELQSAVDLLVEYKRQERATPGKYGAQIADQRDEVIRLGGNPSSLDEPTEKIEVTTEKPDPSNPSITRKEKQIVQRPVSRGTELVRVTSKAEADALPSGTMFIGPDGQRRRKP